MINSLLLRARKPRNEHCIKPGVAHSSLTRTLIDVVEDNVDLHELGRHELWRVTDLLDRNVELRRQINRPELFIDFRMERVVADPIACVVELYDHFDIELNDATRAAMERFMQRRGMQARTPHRYDPADYGLDLDALWPRFESYRAFYDLPERIT